MGDARRGGGEDTADRSCADAMAQTQKLALDAPVPPAGVLSGQLLDQFADLLRDRRASRGFRIGPFVLDQPPVPREQGAGRHDPVQPKAAGQQPRERGDHGAISPVRLRTGDLTAQDRDLMPQHQNLRVLRGVAPREQRQPAEQPDHEQIDEAKDHEG